jgi:prepilin-type N-terminal cleavage/methylation domain-containing protein
MSTPTRRPLGTGQPPGGEAGFTLIEVLIAAVVLVIGLTTLYGLLETSVKAGETTRAREGATNLARQVLEDAHSLPYAQISPSSITSELQALPGLANTSGGSSWQIVQRGITYTLTTSECAIDDPKDGYGPHVNAFGENNFCAESSTTGTADSTPEDFKRITVEVSWTVRGHTRTLQQVQTLSAAGESPGLPASGLRLEEPVVTEPTKPVVSSEPAGEKLVFTVQAPKGTAAIRWSLEGSVQTPDPVYVSGTTWTFSWPIPYPAVSDGTYTVTAQAINTTGVTGPPVSIPVTLIRGVPAAVSGIKGGFNTIRVKNKAKEVVELQWTANKERNVIGYRVFSPSSTLVCPEGVSTLSVALTCVDYSPPAQSATNLTYSVVALYRGAEGVLLQGPAGTLAVRGGAAPEPPTGLTLTPNANGSLTLRWTASSSPEITFYRIYRGSTNYESRYAITAGNTTEFTDDEASSEHTYWVTAVNASLTESSFLGPMTGMGG